MTRLKKIVCLFFVFVMTASFMVGCAFFERDVDYYNNLVVATIGPNIKITKGQLVQAYNSFGYQYVSEQGLSTKEAYNNTLDELINREIMVELAIQDFSFNDLSASEKTTRIKNLRGKSGIESLFYNALYENEKAEVRKQAFDSLNKYFVELQNKVREERKLEFKSPEDAEDLNLATATAAQDPFKPFEPLVIRNDTNTVFDMDISAYVSRESFFEYKNVVLNEGEADEKIVTVLDRALVADTWSPDIDDSDDSIVKTVKTEALARLVRVLSNNERGMKVGTKEAVSVDEPKYLTLKERAIIGREIGRMVEDYSKSILLQRYQDCFDLGISKPIDRSQFARAEGYELAIRAAILGVDNIPVRTSFNNASEHEAAIRELIRVVAGGHTLDCVDVDCEGCSTFVSTQKGRAENLKTQAEDFYRSQVLSQYNRYVKKMDTSASLASKVIEGLSGVYWLPKNVAENNFTVSHILIQYNEEQKAEFESIKSEFASGGYVGVDDYNTKMDELAGKISVRARDRDGIEYGKEVKATTILGEIIGKIGGTVTKVPQPNGSLKDNILAPSYQNGNSADRRAEEARRINIFRDYIYKYNQDPGMSNPEYEYVIGLENSKMVAEFTDASRELFGYMKVAKMNGSKPVFDQNGPVYEWKGVNSVPGLHLANCDGFKGGEKCNGCKNNFAPQRSSMTNNLVMTEFGAHIIMFTRPLSDFIYNTDIKSDYTKFEMAFGTEMNNYLYAPMTSYGNKFGEYVGAALKQGEKSDTREFKAAINAPAKAIFDVAVESATKPAFDNKRNSLLVGFKNERKNGKEDGKLINKITIHRGNFKDLIR